jgi:hypothetical protein
MKSSIIEILFEVIQKITVPSKELLPQQEGELTCRSMESSVAKQLCRLAAEVEQEAEDRKISPCLKGSESPEDMELWFRRMIIRFMAEYDIRNQTNYWAASELLLRKNFMVVTKLDDLTGAQSTCVH